MFKAVRCEALYINWYKESVALWNFYCSRVNVFVLSLLGYEETVLRRQTSKDTGSADIQTNRQNHTTLIFSLVKFPDTSTSMAAK